jgi:protein-L-isoaspartate(D-aspartate) O-methyltransferase
MQARPRSALPVRYRRRSRAGWVAAPIGVVLLVAALILLDARDRSSAAPAVTAAAPAAEQGSAPAARIAQDPSPAAPPSAAASALPAQSAGTVLNDGSQGYDVSARRGSVPTSSRAQFVSWMLAHTDQKEKFLGQKWDLAQGMVRDGSITHPRVLQAFLRTPREYFARDTRRSYENAVLPIGYGQTISGPYMVGRMTDNLDPQPGQKVLEIGTGSGYQSAFLSELTTHVFTVEIVRPLALETDGIYRKHETAYPEFGNISRKIDDGYYGWPEHAPYDRIIVTCGIDHVPPELLRELAPGGIMVIPVGPPSGQTVLRITKRVEADGTVTLDRKDIFNGKRKQIFVPFTSLDKGIHDSSIPRATR